MTPHAIGVIFILCGAACFMSSVRRRVPDYLLLVLAAVFGSVFNFIDLLVNPPWMPMLLAFSVVCGMRDQTKRRASTAIFVALAWFALAMPFYKALDGWVYSLGGVIGGHAVKHLLAGLGMFWLFWFMLRPRRVRGVRT